MRIKKYKFVALSAMLCFLCVSIIGCAKPPKTLYKSDNIEVVREGKITTVYDLEADRQYIYQTVRVKRSEGKITAYTSIDTDTLKIEVIPHGLRIYDKAESKILTIKRKSLQKWG